MGWRNRNIVWKMDDIHLTSIAHTDDICLLSSWFRGSWLGDWPGRNKHSSLSRHIFELGRSLDPMIRENHVRWSAKTSLQQQRLSDDEENTEGHGSVREMVKHPLRCFPGPLKLSPCENSCGHEQHQFQILDPADSSRLVGVVVVACCTFWATDCLFSRHL